MKHSSKNNTFTAAVLPVMAGAFTATILGLSMVSGYAGVETAIGSDVSAHELRAITVESFDQDFSGGGYAWEVHTNRDKKPDDPNAPYEPVYSNAMVEREVKLVSGTPGDVRENQDFADAKVLGVKFAFTFPGFNVVSIKPPHVDQYVIERPRPMFNEQVVEGQIKPKSCYKDPAMAELELTNRGQFVDCIYGVELPGQVKQVSIWVAGRGNEYNLEGWFEDWKGDNHILNFGTLDFVGWRPLTIEIPDNIPQDVASFPQIKTLVFKQFKIRATPNTSMEKVILFMDELRVLTDIFEVYFDGAQLDFDQADCQRKNRLLKVIRRHARYPEHFRTPTDCSKAPGPATPGQGGGGNAGNPGANNPGGAAANPAGP